MAGYEKENILLICDVPPCKNYSGGIASLQLAKFLIEEKHNFNCFCIMNKYLKPDFDESIERETNIVFVNRPVEDFVSNYRNKKNYQKDIKFIIKKCIKFIKKNNITKIWCTVQGEVITKVLNGVFNATNIPYIVQIWDPIEWWMQANNFTEVRKNDTMTQYKTMLSNANYCITASENMTDYYESKYKVKCDNIITSHSNIIKSNVKNNKKDFIIAISGQIYSKEETATLLDILEKMNWRYKDKDIYFYYYGMWSDSYVDMKKYDANHIIIKGFYPQEELYKELVNADLLYCPYFFSEDTALKSVATLSFPSKLVSYLAVGKPSLIHAPEYAAPYSFIKKYKAGYLLDTLDGIAIESKIKNIIENYDKTFLEITNNSKKAFEENFISSTSKEKFMKALDIQYSKDKKLKILEVNNVDLPGRRFNGYDLQKEINENTPNICKQIITYKTSNSNHVYEFFKHLKVVELENRLNKMEYNELSIHNQLSITSDALLNSDLYKNSDIIHYHLIHNTKLSLVSLKDLMGNKPAVFTIHDPWIFTGRCVYPQECELWKNGCEKCEHLNSIFPFWKDNCKYLWKQKEVLYKGLDIDIIVSSDFMLDMIKTSPMTKHFKNIHKVPFGIDLDKFANKISKEDARKDFNIPKDNIVLFFRAQLAAKGTEFIVEALKELRTDKKITLLTCSEVGILKELESNYHVIDLGHIDDDLMLKAYSASDIFLMPSRGESFGLMAIESMASSLPIIIFDNSALPSVTFAPDCGVLVKNKDSHDLMEKINWLINDEEERVKRGNLGRKLAEEHYDIKNYHRKILEVYKKAYDRQKNKIYLKDKDIEIDFSQKDVQNIVYKLNKISKKLLGQTLEYKYNENFTPTITGDEEIDYSLPEVQAIIKEFNKKLYTEVKDYERTLIETPYEPTYERIRFFHMLRNEKRKLVNLIKAKYNNNKVVYKLLEITYLLLTKTYRFLTRYKRIDKKINETMEKANYIYDLNMENEEEIKSLYSNILDLEEKIARIENSKGDKNDRS